PKQPRGITHFQTNRHRSCRPHNPETTQTAGTHVGEAPGGKPAPQESGTLT
ncbi:Hypothetical predicted protein, partial [Pelobates cultripes]